MWFTRGKQQESSIVRKGRSFIARTLKGDLRPRLYESRNINLPTHTWAHTPGGKQSHRTAKTKTRLHPPAPSPLLLNSYQSILLYSSFDTFLVLTSDRLILLLLLLLHALHALS